MAIRRQNQIKEVVSTCVREGILTKENLGLNQEQVNDIYTKAKRLYDAGKYTDANNLFSLLITMDGSQPDFYFGLASTCMMLGQLDHAIHGFMHYASKVTDDPRPFYYMGNCFEKNKDFGSAILAFKTAHERGMLHSKFKEIGMRAELELKRIIAKQEKQQK